ncbi:hypothetical protein D3C76_1242800 [compost metagenome]
MQGAIVVDRVQPQHAGGAFIGLQQPGQHPHQGGFARAVRADQPGDVAFLQRTVERRDGGLLHPGKAFNQPGELDHRVTHGLAHYRS